MNNNNFKLVSFNYLMEEYSQYYSDPSLKLRDLEEKQRTIKDRLILFGENLVEFKEKTSSEIVEIKKSLQEISFTIGRLKSFTESLSSEISGFAKKEDLEILSKQAKMFQPLEFVRKSDLEKLKKNL